MIKACIEMYIDFLFVKFTIRWVGTIYRTYRRAREDAVIWIGRGRAQRLGHRQSHRKTPTNSHVRVTSSHPASIKMTWFLPAAFISYCKKSYILNFFFPLTCTYMQASSSLINFKSVCARRCLWRYSRLHEITFSPFIFKINYKNLLLSHPSPSLFYLNCQAVFN